MPNRIIKESAFTSDKIAALTDFEFRLWVGLITQADDTGRGDARPAIIKGRVFALRDRTTTKDIDTALHALAAHGCVFLYTVDGKPYYEFPNWTAHQRVRDVKSKYPSKADADILPQVAADCRELPQNAALIQSNPNPIQSESESKSVSRFAPPTRKEAEEYYAEIKASFGIDAWFAYYEQNGWMVGRGKMKDWKASMRYWQSKQKPTMQNTAKGIDSAEDARKKIERMKKMLEAQA